MCYSLNQYIIEIYFKW